MYLSPSHSCHFMSIYRFGLNIPFFLLFFFCVYFHFLSRDSGLLGASRYWE
jgi:hypothetical protein